jgi:hypothetical protein
MKRSKTFEIEIYRGDKKVICRLENNTFRYNKLKVEEKDVDRKHEEELESWADKFYSSGE